MEETIKALTELGSAGVQQAIEGYTRWYLVYAIGWLLVGIASVVCGVKVTKLKTEDFDGWNEVVRYIVGGAVVFVGLWMIVYNLPTVLSPAAYATHQFIIDITP